MRDALELDELLPILSESTASIDTRFGTAAEFRRKAEEICGRRAFTGIAEAETISGENKLDALDRVPVHRQHSVKDSPRHNRQLCHDGCQSPREVQRVCRAGACDKRCIVGFFPVTCKTI